MSIYLHAGKRSYSARLLQFLNLTASKTKEFSATPPIFEVDNIKNQVILGDFRSFRSWQHQKRSKFARLPSKMNSWVQSWQPRTNVYCDFNSICLKKCACHESEARSYEVLHLSRKITLANLKIWCSKMQPISGNQRPDLLTCLNHVSLVLRLLRDMHLCGSSSNVPRLPTSLELL